LRGNFSACKSATLDLFLRRNVIIANKLACQLYLGDSICIVRMFLFLGVLFIAEPLIAAENLLIVDVYARILPEGQIEPIPDPFIELIVSGKQGPLPSGVQQLQGKTFQIQSASVILRPSSRESMLRESNSPLQHASCRMGDVRSQISSWPHQSPPEATCCHQIHRKR
jgi:hypothetical protein